MNKYTIEDYLKTLSDYNIYDKYFHMIDAICTIINDDLDAVKIIEEFENAIFLLRNSGKI